MSIVRIPPSKPSSAEYVTELVPRTSLRRRVLVSGWVLLLTGSVIIMHLSVPIGVRLVLEALWLADTGSGLARLASAQAGVSQLRMFADGCCLGRDRRGVWTRYRLLPNSVLTQRVAWLRFADENGRRYSELFWHRQVESEAWRRLQVIWRWGGQIETS